MKLLLLVITPTAGFFLLQPLSMLDTSDNNYNSEHLAFALINAQPISQKLNYAYFLPLTNNINLHQVKVLVDYDPISAGQFGVMKVYASNRTLVKTSSSPNGLKAISVDKAQFATSLSDITIDQVTAHIVFTDSSKIANFSNPINVKLNLGQIIQPTL
jgi:hypothetical protein